MRSLKVLAATSCLTLMLSSAVLAVPAVNGVQGEFETGSTVTVTGSGFGAKAAAAPLVFDDFESGAVGSLVAGKAPRIRGIGSSWVWDDYTSATERPLYSNQRARTNSTRSAQMHFVGNTYNNSLEIFYPRTQSGDEVYFTFWYFYDRSSTNYSRNHKPWIVYGNNGGYYPAAYDGWGNPAVGDGTLRNSVQDSGSTGATLWGGPDMSTVGGKWIRLEGYLKQSSPGTPNGAFQIWSHDPNAGALIKLIQNNTGYITRSSNNYWQQWHFGSYHDNTPTAAEANIYIDDIYFDNTRARVEIGDAATWDACKHREVQAASSWATNSIQVRFNKGSFAAGSRAYMYVVDASGAVNSSGVPITIGSSGGTAAPTSAPPAAPSGLKVN